jgi:hypothetical protein
MMLGLSNQEWQERKDNISADNDLKAVNKYYGY